MAGADCLPAVIVSFSFPEVVSCIFICQERDIPVRISLAEFPVGSATFQLYKKRESHIKVYQFST